jgi:integrase/recombinase XerC
MPPRKGKKRISKEHIMDLMIRQQDTHEVQARQFGTAAFSRFVSWIDRPAKTTQTYLTNLRQFAAFLRYQGVQQPTRETIQSYRQWLLSEHTAIVLDESSPDGYRVRLDRCGREIKITCRVTTVAAYLRSVSQFFKWAAAEGIYPNIATNIHPPKVRNDTHRRGVLTAAQVMRIEGSIEQHAAEHLADAQAAAKDSAGRAARSIEQSARLRAMYLLAVTAGLRCIEISRARVRDLQLAGDSAALMIWGKGRSEPDQRKELAPEVAEAIRAYLKTRSDRFNGASPLFVGTGNRSGGAAIASTTISKMLKAAMQAAGFDAENLTAHSLRHTAGNSVRKITQNNIYETQKYMRHSSPATTEIYMHDDEEDIRAQAALARQLFTYYRTQGRTSAAV